MNIREFKKGDMITRVEPVIVKRRVLNEDLGMYVDQEPVKELSLIGAKIKFLGIANSCINISAGFSVLNLVLSEENPYQWENGWAYFEEFTENEEPQVEPEPVKDKRFMNIFYLIWLSLAVGSFGWQFEQKWIYWPWIISVLVAMWKCRDYFNDPQKPRTMRPGRSFFADFY